MPRGSKPGQPRGPYRPHTRRRLVTDDQVRAIRSAESIDAAWLALNQAGTRLDRQTVAAIRQRRRKAGVPDDAVHD